MITSKDVRKEMEIAEKAGKGKPIEVVVKLLCVILKVLLSIRTNTKLIMVKSGVKPIETRRGEKTTVKEDVAKTNLKDKVVNLRKEKNVVK